MKSLKIAPTAQAEKSATNSVTAQWRNTKMIEELLFIHSRLTKDQCMRIVLIRNNWEITVDKTDLVGEFNGAFRIVRANGTITSINPDTVAMACIMNKRSVLL